MMFTTVIAETVFVASIFLSVIIAKPLENEDYRQYQNSGGNSYAPPILSSAGAFGGSQNNGFSSMVNPGMFLPQSIPSSSINSFGNPFGSQSFGASSYGAPGGYSSGLPNFFG